MKIVIAPDSFKESLSAKMVCSAIERGFRNSFPDADYVHLPLADGGEGTVDVLMESLGGSLQKTQVEGPTGEIVNAHWALLDDGKTALIEVASASGLDLLTREKRNPLFTSTYGTGQLIKNALDHGVSKILIGLGGSATNDGGAGIVQALGGHLYDSQGNELLKGGGELSRLSMIKLNGLDSRCQNIEMIVACDVTNPLCGPHGASHVFGPQKGASVADIDKLDTGLMTFSSFVSPNKQFDPLFTPGYGAAGGTPLGLSLAFDVQLKPGIDMVLEAIDARSIIKSADLVITGEGQMDNQTIQGKAPWGVAKYAKEKDVPVIAIAGSLGTDIHKLYSHIDSVFGSVRSPQSLSQVLIEAEANLIRTARNIAATLKLGKTLI
ncbi:glycerate kinase [Vibrio alginolyticus]|nr:glycerate kinase [Vibrio alginolyticus]